MAGLVVVLVIAAAGLLLFTRLGRAATGRKPWRYNDGSGSGGSHHGSSGFGMYGGGGDSSGGWGGGTAAVVVVATAVAAVVAADPIEILSIGKTRPGREEFLAWT